MLNQVQHNVVVKQLVDPEMVQRIMLFIAVTGPIVGLIVGLFVGAHERCAWPKIVAGTLIGMCGTLAYGMWIIYSLVANRLVLGSVENLGLQLIVFAVLGAILGAVSFGISNMLKRRYVD